MVCRFSFLKIFSNGYLFHWKIFRTFAENNGSRMEKVLKFAKKEALTIIGAAAGAVGGFLYWRYVGCGTGTCPITSSPYMSTLWGGLAGGLLFSAFKKNKK